MKIFFVSYSMLRRQLRLVRCPKNILFIACQSHYVKGKERNERSQHCDNTTLSWWIAIYIFPYSKIGAFIRVSPQKKSKKQHFEPKLLD
jgi:hypothetical protein